MKKIISIMIVALFYLSGICIAVASNNVAIIDNQPPTAPIIKGPMRGVVGTNYYFTFNSTDPDGDDVLYIVDWNDGSNLEITDFYPSGEEVTLNHSWDHEGAFSIMGGAIDIYDLPGKPAYWLIGIGKSKNINQISQIMLFKNFKKFLYTHIMQQLMPIISTVLK
ncbi:hypothetical protein AYK20_04290 [Thermoplasmatales archaeon SG8-52-1]|nr:MAG: hypothetical protein AYK20_04290 [Thermoplasmatales archaeon SG8-52-1]